MDGKQPKQDVHKARVSPELLLEREQCRWSHRRPVWRLIDVRAVLVAYYV